MLPLTLCNEFQETFAFKDDLSCQVFAAVPKAASPSWWKRFVPIPDVVMDLFIRQPVDKSGTYVSILNF